MVFQPVVDAAQINMIFTLNAVPAENVFYAEFVGGYSLADLAALAAQIDVNWQGNWRTEQPIEAEYVRTDVRGLSVPNDLQVSNNTSANAGLHVSPTMPSNVTFAIKKESGFTGRAARGRTYWIGIPTSEVRAVDENTLAGAYINLIVANVDSVRTSIIAVAGWTPILVSRWFEGALRAQGEKFPWISSIDVNNRIDTQRGRLQ